MADPNAAQAQKQVLDIPAEVILDVDETMRALMKDIIYKAFKDETSADAMCKYLKGKLEEKEEGKWNVVIGKDFATNVSHKSRRYGLFKVGELSVLIWQSGCTYL